MEKEKSFYARMAVMAIVGTIALTSCASTKKTCGSSEYSEYNQFCYNDKVYNKCFELNDNNVAIRLWSYDPSTESCLMKCGSNEYNKDTQFCYEKVVYDKCSDRIYKPSIQVCSDDTILTKCGSDFYNYSTHYCKSGNTPTAYSTFTDERDGNKYKYVIIGNQVWMAENLAYTEKGTLLDFGTCLEPEDKNCNIYGRYYKQSGIGSCPQNNKNCLLQLSYSKQICPNGWHLPNVDEWNELIATVGGKEIAGKQLKAKSGWRIGLNDGGNGLDAYGFRAIPGRCKFVRYYGSVISPNEPNCGHIGTDAAWLSSSALGANEIFRGVAMGNTARTAIIFTMSSGHNNVNINDSDIKAGNEFSVRCVADEPQAQQLRKYNKAQQQMLQQHQDSEQEQEQEQE